MDKKVVKKLGIFFVFMFSLILLSSPSGAYYDYDYSIGEDGFRLVGGYGKVVSIGIYGCYIVVNQVARDVFVPTKTLAEWQSFINNLPYGVVWGGYPCYTGGGDGTGGDTGDTECFLAGTKVTMVDGTYKFIENIEIGDEVKHYNFQNDKIEDTIVIGTRNPIHDDIVEFIFSNGVSSKHTYDHPYYVLGKGWSSFRPELTKERYNIDTKKIKEGDLVKTDENKIIELVKINVLDKKETETYNFYVKADDANSHNYYADGILVHNKGTGSAPDADTGADSGWGIGFGLGQE